jgi:hypothetical protein
LATLDLNSSSGPTYARFSPSLATGGCRQPLANGKKDKAFAPKKNEFLRSRVFIEILLASCHFSACATLPPIWRLKAALLSTDSLFYNYYSLNLLRYSILGAVAIF